MNRRSLLYAVCILSITIITGCRKTDKVGVLTELEYDPYPYVTAGTTIWGEINEDITLRKNETYFIAGGVHIKPGVTITIEEGVTVKSDPIEPVTAYLLVEPGAKINARGTADKPIVFTSGNDKPQVQDWGGLVICGKAPINTPGGTAASEMGAGVTYGGNDVMDNSGVLSYVRVEYTGKKQNQTKEHNGFTFEGVGAGTEIDHISVYKCGDDGIEFFGGTVRVRYAFVHGAYDDCYDWTYGWQGKGQFWVATQGEATGDRGFENDNNGLNNLASPFSKPRVANVTLVGNAAIKNVEGKSTRALKLREGVKGELYNLVAYGFTSGVEVQHNQTLLNMEQNNLIVKGLNLSNNSPWKYSPNNGLWNGVRPFENDPSNVVEYNNGAPSFMNGVVGTVPSSINAMNIDTWFVSAPYKGAVASNNDWTKENWVKY